MEIRTLRIYRIFIILGLLYTIWRRNIIGSILLVFVILFVSSYIDYKKSLELIDQIDDDLKIPKEEFINNFMKMSKKQGISKVKEIIKSDLASFLDSKDSLKPAEKEALKFYYNQLIKEASFKVMEAREEDFMVYYRRLICKKGILEARQETYKLIEDYKIRKSKVSFASHLISTNHVYELMNQVEREFE